MHLGSDRRRDSRIRFSWPLFFGYEDNGQFTRGQVVDLSRSGVGFTVAADECPSVGSHVLTRFSYPLEEEDHFEMNTYYHWAEVIRVEDVHYGSCRVGMRLHESLKHDFRDAAQMEPAFTTS
jgi:PilZ domain-containing protein